MKQRVFLLTLILITLASTVRAQTPQWEVTVDKTEVTTDDTIQLSIVIRNVATSSLPMASTKT